MHGCGVWSNIYTVYTVVGGNPVHEIFEPAHLHAQVTPQRHTVVEPTEVFRGHRRGAKHREVGAVREQPRVLLRQVWWYQWQLERLS